MAARKKTTEKTETTETKVEETPRAAARKAPAKPKAAKLPHEVVHEGNRIYLRGTDVTLREIPQSEWSRLGLKGIVGGVAGKPCAEETVLTFKSPRSAASFFADQFNEVDDDKAYVITGGKADWMGDSMYEAARALASR